MYVFFMVNTCIQYSSGLTFILIPLIYSLSLIQPSSLKPSLHLFDSENASIDVSLSYVNQQKVGSFFTPYWAVEIKGGETVARLLADTYGFLYVGEIMPGIYHFKHKRISKRSVHHSIYYHEQLAHDKQVIWLEQQVAKVRTKRDLQVPVNDPKWYQMWYLNRGGPSGLDMNVRPVWARGYAGQGVVVTILDDGLETDHPDLKDNYDPFASYDVNSNDDNPEPRYLTRDKSNTNRHGTRCAGEVAAVANNSVCGLGIAFKARIGGVRMLDGDVTDAMESRSLSHRLQHIDVYSASWGPEDDGKTVDGPGRLAQMAFRNGIQMGRGGLGSIFVWASGNGGKSRDNCNCDGYTNSIYTLGVSSASEHGTVPWYAEMCSSTLAVTYSSGGRDERGVITTDLNHTCTDSHSGTSASAPLAAGICALTLSANSRLTWRDLQYLVVYTARPDGLYANDWHVNGVGRRVSHAFGYGLMDAAAMVDLALNWTNVPAQRVCEAQAPMAGSPITIRQMVREKLSLTTDGCASAAALADEPLRRVVYLEHVQAKVTLSSAQRGEIELWLTSPSNTVSKLLSKRPKDVDVAGFHAWPFMSVHFWGELAKGTWKLTIDSGNAVVSIHDWSLILYGTSTLPPLHGMWPNKRGVRQSETKTTRINDAHLMHKSPTNDFAFSHPAKVTAHSQQPSVHKTYPSQPTLSYPIKTSNPHFDSQLSKSKSPMEQISPHFYYFKNNHQLHYPYAYWNAWNHRILSSHRSPYLSQSHSSPDRPPPPPPPPPPSSAAVNQLGDYSQYFSQSFAHSDNIGSATAKKHRPALAGDATEPDLPPLMIQTGSYDPRVNTYDVGTNDHAGLETKRVASPTVIYVTTSSQSFLVYCWKMCWLGAFLTVWMT